MLSKRKILALFFVLMMVVVPLSAQEKGGAGQRKGPARQGAKSNDAWGGAPQKRFHFAPHGGPNMQNMQAVFKKHPEFQRLIEEDLFLERETRALVKRIKGASGDEKEKLLAGLESLVKKHFEVRQAKRKYELKLMEERISKIREELEERDQKADRIVERRVRDLVEEDEDLKF
ncbi:MAG: hypothetical protein Q4D38_08750 [Planctomycetia bacterium]|nr:hypothetical protein [Planctomycetia bacterium]